MLNNIILTMNGDKSVPKYCKWRFLIRKSLNQNLQNFGNYRIRGMVH